MLNRFQANIYINSLAQDCSISIAIALEILQSCTKQSMFTFKHDFFHNVKTKFIDTTQYIPRIMHTIRNFVVVLKMINFSHILQGNFTDTGAITWQPQCQWSNTKEYDSKHVYTVECHYYMVHYNKILLTSLQKLRQNIKQRLNPQKT